LDLILEVFSNLNDSVILQSSPAAAVSIPMGDSAGSIAGSQPDTAQLIATQLSESVTALKADAVMDCSPPTAEK